MLESAGFSAELDKGDFYRENNDGTVSVHVSSNNAEASYTEDLFDPTSLSLSGTGAQFSANYTGKVVEIPIPGGVIRFIDLETVERAVSIRGNGWVQDEGGNVYKLSLAIGQTPSGNRRAGFSVTARG